jgi:transposase
MVRDRGYSGSIVQLRRTAARLRPQKREAFLQLHTFPGEQGQVDWAHFGYVMVGRAKRALSCFVMTLSYSRALYLEFFFDQTLENFLRGHVHAFHAWSGQPRVILYDNLKSAVLERRGNQILFHPRLVELSGHYHFSPQLCQVRKGNQKGRVERAIRYVRDSFWQAALSQHWLNAIDRLYSGAVKSPINGAGLAATIALSPKLSLKNNRGCCLLLCIRSRLIGSRPCARARPSMSASISTITPSHRKRSDAS